jgi:iron complex outermembrane recepter protein
MMPPTRFLRRPTALAVAALAAATLPAAAQQAAAPAAAASAPPETVVVTANRRNEAARDVPMAIDVVTAKDLERYNLLDAKDIAKVAPGVEMTNNDGRQNVAAMRGVSFNPDTGVSIAAVGVHVNEVPVSANVAFNAIYDLAQVEVLRGPQGTLRGQMTPAGAITMATRRPDLARFGGELLASVDNQGGRNLRGAFNVPVVSDVFALRFAAVTDRNRLNQVSDPFAGERSHGKTESYRLSAAWQATPDLRFDVMTQTLNVDNVVVKQVVGSGVVLPFSLGRPAVPYNEEDFVGVTDVPGRFDTRSRLTTMKAHWSIDEHHTLAFVGSAQRFDLGQGFDRDLGNVVPGTVIWQQVDTSVKTKTAEVIFASEDQPFWNYTFGLYADRTTAGSAVDVASGAVKIDIPGAGTTRAAYTRQSFKLTEDLTFDAGLRYSRIKTERQSVLSVPGFTFPPSIPPQFADVEDKPTTWGLSLTNRFNRSLTGYVAVGHSFRPGTYQVGVFNPVDPKLLGQGPEKSDALEVGFKSDVLDRKGSLNVAAFVQKYKGYIDYVPDATYQFVDFAGQTQRDAGPFNSQGDARVAGLEAQFFVRPLPNWDANVAASWVASRYTAGSRPCNDSNGDGIPDSDGPSAIPAGQQVAMCPLTGRISELPRFSVAAASEYRFALGGLLPYVGFQVNHRPGFHSEKVDYDYASFTNLSLFAGVRSASGAWEAGLFVKNALNQQRIHYTTGTNSLTALPGVVPGVSQFDSGYREVVTTVPRSVGVTARYTF